MFHFILNILADNQISKIIENDIFRRFDILSFTRSSLHYTFSKFTIKYISFYRFYLQLIWELLLFSIFSVITVNSSIFRNQSNFRMWTNSQNSKRLNCVVVFVKSKTKWNKFWRKNLEKTIPISNALKFDDNKEYLDHVKVKFNPMRHYICN